MLGFDDVDCYVGLLVCVLGLVILVYFGCLLCIDVIWVLVMWSCFCVGLFELVGV